MSHGARLAAHSAVSTSLALYSDRALRELVDTAVPIGSGIGGTSALLEIAGTPVFVKRVPLTDLERQPGHVRSTANLFELPAFCQYGTGAIGSPGFGAWRELAVHTMTTNWVLAAEHEGFPLMYHWRVLPDSTPLPAELADVERAVAYWGGGTQVRRRIEALRQSSASVALFLEYIPQNLHQWLGTQVEAGDEAVDRACAMVERELEATTSFMNARGSCTSTRTSRTSSPTAGASTSRTTASRPPPGSSCRGRRPTPSTGISPTTAVTPPRIW
ncbi:hypothetical protein HFP72_02335 [Nocardiopsis sp. ARC36]